jgi:hypothetical protein
MIGLICIVIGHQRLGRAVWEQDNQLRSRCRRCDAPMVKKNDAVWVVDRRPPDRVPEPNAAQHAATGQSRPAELEPEKV